MNDELRNKLAEKDADISRLQLALADTEALELGTAERLAASQAREQQLRDVFKQTLKLSEVKVLMPSTIEAICRNAISLPADTTALSDMITIAGEVMRDRCHSEIPAADMDGSGWAIRALPAVTINDLK